MPVFVGFGNPLLDFTFKLGDTCKEIFKKHNLEKDGQKEITFKDLENLTAELFEANLDVSVSAGGCAQNTLRVLQWLMRTPNCTYMCGCVGKDTEAKNLEQLVNKDGVQTRYIVHETEKTGRSVALVTGSNRCLVAHLGAALHLQIKDIMLLEKTHKLLSNSQVIYLEGFFLTNRLEVANYLLDYSKEHKKLFVFNLCGPYIIKRYPKEVTYFALQNDIMFGNAREFTTLCELMQFEGDMKKFAASLTANNPRPDLKYGKIVVITDGSGPIICAHSGGTCVEQITPIRLEDDKIVDTIGAGDAFVAGFLAALFENKSPKACLKKGCWAAQQIIQQVGCTFPVSSEKGLTDCEYSENSKHLHT